MPEPAKNDAIASKLPREVDHRIARTPGVCGGNARVRGTRISVWLLEAARREGCTRVEICQRYGLTEEDLIAAEEYASFFPDEITAQMAANEE